jgi:hippurate hydrolase
MDPKILERVVAFRRELHTFPEISLKEFETHKRIKSFLIELGVESGWIREMKPTGLVVDIKGKAAPKGKGFCVAFRADMDALSMTEENDHLEYKSQNKGAAHMCGHDGHMACLIGFVPLFLASLSAIPSNKTVRLLFQPSEEGPVAGA